MLPLLSANPPYSKDPKSSHDDGSKPLGDDGKKVDEDPRKDSECNDQEKEDNVSNTNNVNAASTNKVNAVGGKTSIELPFDPNMPALEDYSIFDFSRNNEDDGVEADINNLDTTIQVSPIPTTRIHKDHPLDLLIKRRTQKGNSCIEGSKLDRGYAGRASTIKIEAIRLLLAYALFKDFVMYQMDVKSVVLYGKIEEEVYVCQPSGFEDPYFPDRVYKVKKQCMEYIMLLELYPKDSPFDLVAYTNSDYAGASLDRKSTTGGCQFLGCRLISWQSKKQTVVANSTTEAECFKLLWTRKAKKSIRLMMEQLFGMELELIL
ncbi:retrovirus-related pol polyprotein from transposon TNT 1-94, partial [Tanacetum coccineum]